MHHAEGVEGAEGAAHTTIDGELEEPHAAARREERVRKRSAREVPTEVAGDVHHLIRSVHWGGDGLGRKQFVG